VEPIDLLLDLFTQAFPLLEVRLGWKDPEYLLHTLDEQWVSIVQYENTYQVEIEKVQNQVLSLVLLHSNAEEECQSQIVEDLVLEEEGDLISY